MKTRELQDEEHSQRTLAQRAQPRGDISRAPTMSLWSGKQYQPDLPEKEETPIQRGMVQVLNADDTENKDNVTNADIQARSIHLLISRHSYKSSAALKA